MKNTRARSRDFGKGDWKSYFRLIPYIRLPWLLIAAAFVVDLVYSDVMAYVPVSTSALFGGEFTGRALASAVIYNVLNFGLMLGSLIFTSVVSSIAVRRAQEVLWGRMLRLDMVYYDTHNPANLMSTLTNDADTAVKSLISQLVSMIPSVYYLVRVCLTLRSYDFRLLLSILILIPVNVIYVVVLGRWRYEVNAGIYSRIGSLTAYLAERVSNIYLIRSFTNEAQEEKNGLEAAEGLCALDAINLFESGLDRLCDRTVAVTAPTELRVKRIMARDHITEQYARLRIGAQKQDEYYRGKCDCELNNATESPEEFRRDAYLFFERLVEAIQEEKRHG